MKKDHYDKIISASGLFAVLSLVVNIPSYLGYPKMWQIIFFGSISIIFMTLSLIRFRKI